MGGKKVKEREHQIREVTEGIEMSSFTVHLIHESSSFTGIAAQCVIPPWRSINHLILHFTPLPPFHYPGLMFYHRNCLKFSWPCCYAKSLSLMCPCNKVQCTVTIKEQSQQKHNLLRGTICYLDAFSVSGFDQTVDRTRRSDIFFLTSCPPEELLLSAANNQKLHYTLMKTYKRGLTAVNETR